MSKPILDLAAILELASVTISAPVPAGRYELDAFIGTMPPDAIAVVTISATFRPESKFVLIPVKS
jgi:hypothetical protein